ncbi:MAG TPA: cytochrome-c peroxidase [Azonexus sp.]|nr:cytochrome-c peroxidase [Azonexus sp.]
MRWALTPRDAAEAPAAALPAMPVKWEHQALRPLLAVATPLSATAQLGQRLFFETRLSRDNSLSCATCHDLRHGGTDNKPVSVGIGGQAGPINAPTVFNASLNFVQFWDGRAASLEEQATGPVHNALEMGSNWAEVIAKLKQDASYRSAFARLYPAGISGEAITDAIAAFERTLLTPNSRFDRFLLGDGSALNDLEQHGYRRFLDLGCASCHQGVGIGGNMYQRFGVMADYFQGRPENTADLGRFNVTGKAEDRHVFKVPGLRNVALTAPYFHDASARTLEEAVLIMGRYQLGRQLSDDDLHAITAFLRTLTGEWQGKQLE